MKPKLALDTNCLIDLEENRADAIHLKTLISAWKGGQIELAVVTVSASENQLGGVASQAFAAFERKLSNIGLGDAHQLNPIAKWDVFYWDHALWSSDEMEALECKIREILFPGIATGLPALMMGDK